MIKVLKIYKLKRLYITRIDEILRTLIHLIFQILGFLIRFSNYKETTRYKIYKTDIIINGVIDS